MIKLQTKRFATFVDAATAFEKIRGVLGHGATLAYADLGVPVVYWDYIASLEHARVCYDSQNADHPCHAIPCHMGDGVFEHTTCTSNTTFTLRPQGVEWIVVIERSPSAPPIGGGWNEGIAEALGVNWSTKYWERVQEEWEAEQPATPPQPAGYAAGHDVEITRVARPTEGGGQ